MYRFLALGAFLAFLVAPAAARAADAPARRDGPTAMLRIQSVDQLLNNGEYIAGLAGYEDQAKQFLGFVRSLAGAKGLEGVDIKQPFVLYANLAPEIANSEIVVMIPVADQETFLALLKNRLALQIDEGKDGLFTTEAPNNLGSIFFRFANGYVYASYKNKEIVAVAKLPKPADVIGKGDSVLSLSFRIDRLPEEMKKFALGSVENVLAQGKEQPLPNETPSIKALKNQTIDSVAGGVKAILTQGEEITLKIGIDSKKDEVTLELEMTAVKGSDLAKDIADLKSKKSVAFGSLNTSKAAMLLAFNASAPASVKKLLGPAMDDLVKLGIDMIPDDAAREIVDPIIKAALPTLKAGDLDMGSLLLGPNAEGKYTFITVGKIAGGKDLEKAIKDAAKKLPEEFRSFVELDADSAGAAKLHAVRVKDKLDENARKILGESDVWLAFRDDAVVVAIGPNAKDAIKDALTKSPAVDSLFKLEFSVGRLIALAEIQDEKAAKKAAKEVFGKEPTGDTLSLSLDGGDSLRLRGGMKGKVIKFVAAMEKAKKDN